MTNLEKVKQEARDLLFGKYETLLLSRSQAAKSVSRSVTTLDRWKKKSVHLTYKKQGEAKNSPVFYPIDSIVDYVCENNIKPFSKK